MQINFLSLAEVLEIHQDQIVRYGGLSGTRDMGLLESALAMPAAVYGGEFLHGDIYEMAVAYLFHIIHNHPFEDGNKRAGAVAAIVFLFLNGYQFDAPNRVLSDFVIALADGKKSKSDAAQFFRKYADKAF